MGKVHDSFYIKDQEQFIFMADGSEPWDHSSLNFKHEVCLYGLWPILSQTLESLPVQSKIGV